MRVLEQILQEIDCEVEKEKEICHDIVETSGWRVYQKAMDRAKDIIGNHLLKNDGWIPVEEGLPENSKHEGAFCPKYQVMTDYGVTEGWYNPNAKGWFVLLWFMTGRFAESEIDIERGDVSRVVFIPDGGSVSVSAWKPLPAPYKPKEEEK